MVLLERRFFKSHSAHFRQAWHSKNVSIRLDNLALPEEESPTSRNS